MTEIKFTATEGTKERAIVIGGGIGGLLAARVLSGYYNEVVIVEKDAFPEHPENRAGVPQAFHPHRLTPRGNLILNQYFPGLTDELLESGAPSTQGGTSHLINPYGSVVSVGYWKEASFSRALLEWVLRKRVQSISNISLMDKKDVIALQATPDGARVIGVQVRDRETAQQQVRTLSADLVMDTSGRTSKVTRWLTELGYDVPEPELLEVSLGYSTRHYRIPSDKADQIDVLRIEGDPAKGSFTGVLSIIENNIAEMLLWSIGGRYPATEPAQFEREVAELESPLFAETLQGLEPVTAPRGYRVPHLTRQRFEQMRRFPSGLLVMGDAFANFDPIYGQGMTVAAIEAEILDASLREQRLHPRPDFEQHVLQQLQDTIEPAWWLNSVADLRWPGVKHVGAEPLRGLSFAQRYLDFVLKQSTEHSNQELYGLYWMVNSLFLSPRELFNPQMMTDLLTDSAAGRQLLDEWTSDSEKSLEELLALEIPSFERASFAAMEQLMEQS